MTDYVNLILNYSFKARKLTDEEINRIKQGYNSVTHDDIVRCASKKKQMPFVGKLFCDLNINVDYWCGVVQIYKQRNLYILNVIESIFDKFEEQNIKNVFLYENFGALLASGTDISQFSSGDVDFYADIKERHNIEEALSELNFYYENSNHHENVSSGYYCDQLKEKFYINIMWRPISRDKLPFELDLDNCINWDKLERYKTSSIKLPTPTALMYLCMLHVSAHSYSREPGLRLYKDIENLSKLSIEWEKLYKYAEHDGMEVRIITVAYISNSLIGLNIPNWIINEKNKHQNRVSKILSQVYDEKNETLIYNPRGINLLKVEVFSDSNTFIGGVTNIMFPNTDWIRHHYLMKEGNLIRGYLMHIKNLWYSI